MGGVNLPSYSQGNSALFWAILFFVYIWFGGIAVGISGATSFVLGAVVAAGSWLYIRTYGEDAPRP